MFLLGIYYDVPGTSVTQNTFLRGFIIRIPSKLISKSENITCLTGLQHTVHDAFLSLGCVGIQAEAWSLQPCKCSLFFSLSTHKHGVAPLERETAVRPQSGVANLLARMEAGRRGMSVHGRKGRAGAVRVLAFKAP